MQKSSRDKYNFGVLISEMSHVVCLTIRDNVWLHKDEIDQHYLNYL